MQTGKINWGSNWKFARMASCSLLLNHSVKCHCVTLYAHLNKLFVLLFLISHGLWWRIMVSGQLSILLCLCWKSKCVFMFSSTQASGQVSEPSSLPPSLSSSTLPTLCRWEVTEQPKVSPRCAIASPPSTKMSAAGCLLHLHTVERSCRLPWWSFS